MVEDAACVMGRRWRPPCSGWGLARGDISLHGEGRQGAARCFDGEGSILGTLALAGDVEGSRGEPW
jgi:hypothetical protein